MRPVFRFGLAFGLALLALPAALFAQPRGRPPTTYAQIDPPDQAEGARILEGLRNIGLTGPYYLEFDLRVMPRRGAETRLSGRWFGTRNASGPITRVEIFGTDGSTRVWLVQSGARPSIWSGKAGDTFRLLDSSATAEAGALGGTHITATDVQTPFMFWRDFSYEGLARFRGRPTYVFLLYPPEAEQARLPGIGGVRVFIDTAYEAFSQAQWVDPAGAPVKTITIIDFKEIDGRWIVKSFEVRDEATRDKTRFVVRAAALDVSMPEDLFVPAGEVVPADFQVPAPALKLIR